MEVFAAKRTRGEYIVRQMIWNGYPDHRTQFLKKTLKSPNELHGTMIDDQNPLGIITPISGHMSVS
jgi:hypothetical protein